TEFYVGKNELIATIPNLYGDAIAEGAKFVLGETDFKVAKTRFRADAPTQMAAGRIAQEVHLRQVRRGFLLRLSDGWQTAIGYCLAFLLAAPFIIYFVAMPLIAATVVYQIQSGGYAVLDDADRTIVKREEVGGRPTIDPTRAMEAEQRTLSK